MANLVFKVQLPDPLDHNQEDHGTFPTFNIASSKTWQILRSWAGDQVWGWCFVGCPRLIFNSRNVGGHLRLNGRHWKLWRSKIWCCSLCFQSSRQVDSVVPWSCLPNMHRGSWCTTAFCSLVGPGCLRTSRTTAIFVHIEVRTPLTIITHDCSKSQKLHALSS